MKLILFLIGSVAGALVLYFGVAAAFHALYYRTGRRNSHHWKCQPSRWTPADLRRRDMWLGSANLVWVSLLSGFLGHRIFTDNPTQVYLAGHGFAFSVASTIAYFLVTDLGLYWMHRLFHVRVLYRWIHHVHHRTVTPTVFTATAVHPAEFAAYQVVMALPLFVMPIPVAGVIAALLVHNLFGLVHHSGVRIPQWLPVQPAPQFHDDHHAHVRINFGQALTMWDRLFGTQAS